MNKLQQQALKVSAERTELANTHNTEWFPLDKQLSDGKLLDKVAEVIDRLIEHKPNNVNYASDLVDYENELVELKELIDGRAGVIE